MIIKYILQVILSLGVIITLINFLFPGKGSDIDKKLLANLTACVLFLFMIVFIQSMWR